MVRTATSTTAAAGIQSDAIVFPEGLVGCQTWKRFVLLTDDDEQLPVAYLQSVDDPEVRLLVTDPRLIDQAYVAPLSDADLAAIHADATDKTTLYCTLTINKDGLITANLLGPLVINARTRTGKQLVLSDSSYTTRHPVAHLQEA
jgi:flagellar assembly factor FliW